MTEKNFKNAVVTIGNFDGVHLGHQQIISLLKEKAKARGGESVLITFRPHPQMALTPEKNLKLLLSYDLKIKTLKKLNIDHVIEQPFSREFSNLTPEQFFKEYLLPKAKEIVVGYDFGFGKDRKGSLEFLKAKCAEQNIPLTVVSAFEKEGQVISSSRIRNCIQEGDVTLANQLLGRPYSYLGIVSKGDQRGRRIGFPTANLRLNEEISLKYGVYATRAEVDGVSYASVTNIGVRPTFVSAGEEAPVLVETFLIDQSVDLYGKEIEVSFLKRIRDEKKFSSAKELTDQIALDVQVAKQVCLTKIVTTPKI